MLKSTLNKGFQLTFENGLTISVQWGYGNYCERRSYDKYDSVMQSDSFNESHDAEIAIWDENKKWHDFGSDEVKGWCSADEVAAWITKTANAINIESITNG